MMKDEVVKLTQELIRYQSISPLDVGCQKVLTDYLYDLGFTIEKYPHKEADNFFAHVGTQKPLFCFAGHTDVVPTGPLEEWIHNPFDPVIDGDKLYGRGSADMKGGVAAMLVASKHFLAEQPKFKGQLGFIITSAEEGPSEMGTPIVLDALHKQGVEMDYCVVGEPTAVKRTGDMIKNGRRGSLSATVTFYGKQGHVAYPHLAENPIHRSAAAIHDLANYVWDEGDEYFPPTTLQISNIHGGTGIGNVIPGDVQIQFNLRYSPAITVDDIKANVQSIFDHHELKHDIAWNHSGKPFLTKPGHLIDITKTAIQTVCGIEPELSTSGGTSDGRFIADYCPEIIECGVNNKTIHQINEHTSITDLSQLTEVYYHILCGIFKE